MCSGGSIAPRPAAITCGPSAGRSSKPSWADDGARLEAAGDAATLAFVTDELGKLLGADFARGLSPIAITRWAGQPTIGGSYSHALPGHAPPARSWPAR